MTRLALFDIDGTLVGQHYGGATPKRGAFTRAFREVCGLEGVVYSEVLGELLPGMTDRPIVRETMIRLGVPREEAARKVEAVLAAAVRAFDEMTRGTQAARYPVIPGAREMLDWLRGRGVRLTLATGNLEHFARWKLRTTGLDEYFPAGGFADDSEERTEIVLAAIRRSPGASPGEIVLFGDAPSDVAAAKAAGVPVIVIALSETGGSHPRERLAALSPPPDLIVDGWDERERIRDFLGF